MTDPQEIINRLATHATPTYQDGRCWFCGGGLGHGPNGHKDSCVWVAMRKAATDDQ